MGRTYKDYPKAKQDTMRRQDRMRKAQREAKHSVDYYLMEEYNKVDQQGREPHGRHRNQVPI